MQPQPIIHLPGQGKHVHLAGHPMAFLVTGTHTKHTSMFDWLVPPRFATGRHIHAVQEESFYVLDGTCEWEVDGDVITAPPGSFLFLPPGVAHDIRNPGDRPVRLLMTVSPPGHENYFEELARLAGQGTPPDPAAVGALRQRFDTRQLSSLTVRSGG